jgi:hypothetical protein
LTELVEQQQMIPDQDLLGIEGLAVEHANGSWKRCLVCAGMFAFLPALEGTPVKVGQ